VKAFLLLALPAGAIAAAIPIASSSAAPQTSFALVAKLDRPTLKTVDVRPKGHSGGDTIVYSTSLRRDGKPDGRGEFVQTVVDDRYQGISIHGDLLLGDGTLELQSGGLSRRPPGGAAPQANGDMAVVGGTGAYAGARGTVRLVAAGRTSQRLEVTLAG
jgi:hypothetical protein